MNILPDLSICVLAPGPEKVTERFLQAVFATVDHVSLEIFILGAPPADSGIASAERFPGLKMWAYDSGTSLNRHINRVIRQSSGRYVSLWDHQTVVSSGCLTRLVEFLDEEPDAGVVGPKLRNEQGEIQPVARTFPTFFPLICGGADKLPGGLMPGWHEYAGGEADWYAGPGMTISRYLLNDIGGIHPFLSCFWPVKLCRQAKRGGWHIHYLHDAQATGSLDVWRKTACGGGRPVWRRWLEAQLLQVTV